MSGIEFVLALIGAGMIGFATASLAANKVISNQMKEILEMEARCRTIGSAAAAAHASMKNPNCGKLTRDGLFNRLWDEVGLEKDGSP